MSIFKIGVHLPATQVSSYDVIRKLVRKYDLSGIDILFGYDHFFTPKIAHNDVSQGSDSTNYEGLMALSSWAEITENVILGLLVTGIGYRNPDLLADMSRTIDHISNGRYILGLGAGWYERDYVEYGYSFGTVKTRSAGFRDGLVRIKNRLERLTPQPTRTIPILLGGGGEKVTIPLVAQYADYWHVFGDYATLEHKMSVLKAALRKTDRSFDDITKVTHWPGDVTVAESLVELGFTTFVVSSELINSESFEIHLEQALLWRELHR